MAVRKFILAIGQSNASSIGDAQTWEDENPILALRSPAISAGRRTQKAVGSYETTFTMPGVFPGGPQTGLAGTTGGRGSYQVCNLKGRAIERIRYLTFYNPAASYLNVGTGGQYAYQYPGTGVVFEGSTSTVLSTSVRFQTILRVVASASTPDFTSTAHGIQNGERVRFVLSGGTPGALVINETDWNPATDTVTSAAHGYANGMSVRLTTSVTLPTGLSGTTTYYIVGATTNTFQLALSAGGAAVDFTDDGTGDHTVTRYFLPPEISEDFAYWVVGRTANTFQVSLTEGGAAVAFTGGTGVTVSVATVQVGTITRQKTGTTHNALLTAGASGSSIVLDEPFIPIPEVGEQFTYEIRSCGASTSATTMRLRPMFGGLSDVGTAFAGQQFLYFRMDPGRPGRCICYGFPVYPGLPVVFTLGLGSMPTGLSAATQYYVTRLDQDARSVAFTNGVGTTLTTPAAHKFVSRERVRFSGSSLPTAVGGDIDSSTTYYVERNTDTTFKIARTAGGTPISLTSTGSGTVYSLDSYCSFFVSPDPGGEEVVFASEDLTAVTAMDAQVSFRGSLSGVVVRALTGPNAGDTRVCSDIYFDQTDAISIVTVSEAWDVVPTATDTYRLEPPTINGETIDWHQWAYFLPWSPFEGNATGTALYGGVSVTSGLVTDNIAMSGVFTDEGMEVRLYKASGSTVDPLLIGKPYYAVVSAENALYFSETYGGDPVMGTNGGTDSTLSAIISDHRAKSNPFPPGFNYPNHDPLLRAYQPYDGVMAFYAAPTMAFHTSWAFEESQVSGEDIYVIPLAFGGTSLGVKEVAPPGYEGNTTGFAWIDLQQQLDWSPNRSNNCYARLLDVLACAARAFAAQGDTGECIGIGFLQGEEDSVYQHLADAYERNLTTFKQAVRQAVKDAGLYSGSPGTIPWFQPQIQSDYGDYNTTVNTAIQNVADADPYMRTWPVADVDELPMMPDTVHYAGAGMSTVGRWAFTARRAMERVGATAVDVCNLALSNIGEAGTITSIDPPDGSALAALCARYYPIARDELLTLHDWQWTMRRKALVETTNDRTEYEYAYEVPADLRGVIRLAPAGTPDHDDTEYAYVIEADAYGDRVLYTNVQDAEVRYNTSGDDPTRWSVMFRTALAWKLASMLAGAVVKGEEGVRINRHCIEMFVLHMGMATGHDSNKMQDREQPKSLPPWVRNR